MSLIFLIPSQQINTNRSKIKTKRTAFIFLFIPLMFGCRSLKKSFLQKTNVVECPQWKQSKQNTYEQCGSQSSNNKATNNSCVALFVFPWCKKLQKSFGIFSPSMVVCHRTNLGDKGGSSGWFVSPVGGQLARASVVTGETVDFGFNENQTEFGVSVFAVAFQMFTNGDGFFNEAI